MCCCHKFVELKLLLLLQCQLAVATLDMVSAPSPLAVALSQVLQQSEMSDCNTLDVHVEYSELSARRQLLQLLQELLVHQQHQPHLVRQPLRLSYQRQLEYKPYKHAVLLLVDDIHALRRLYSGQNATSNLSHVLVYMLQLQLQPQPQSARQLGQLWQLLWQLSVLNVALLRPHPEQPQIIQLLSYFPFTKHNCPGDRLRSSVVNQFELLRAKWSSDVFFPAKLGNFYGCPLTCATWPDMPYLVRRPDGAFVGIEGSLLQFMADNLNFSIGIYWLNKSEVRETFNDTGWIFEQIFKSADYALGGFHYKPRDGAAANEMPYSQSTYYFMSHIMLVTNLPSEYSAYEKLAFPFHQHLWRGIGLIVALSYLFIWLYQRCYRRYSQHAYYQLLVLSMGGSLLSSELPQRSSFRVLFVTWLLWAFVLRSAYQSGMYQLLRQDTQRNPPQTISEVLSQHYTIHLVDGNADRWLQSLPELKTQQLRHLAASELQSFGGLAASSGTSQRLAIVTPYEYFGYYRKVHAMSRRLHLVRERIFTQQLAFNVRRYSHIVGVLNDQIMLAHAHGFLEHWTRQYVSAVDERDESIARISAIPYDTLDGLALDADSSDSSADEEISLTKLRILSLTELTALFWLTLWAQLLAILVFVLELALHKYINCCPIL